MDLYFTVKNLNNNIVYSQLISPLILLKKVGYLKDNYVVFLQDTYKAKYGDVDLNTFYYQDNKEKYLYILKNRKIISNIYSRSLFEFLILYFLRLFIFTKYRI